MRAHEGTPLNLPSARQQAAALALAWALTMLQLWLVAQGTGGRHVADAADRLPPRLQVVFVQVLQPATPPVTAIAWAPPAPRPPAIPIPASIPILRAAAGAASAPEVQAQMAPAAPTPALDGAEFQVAELPPPAPADAAAELAAASAPGAPAGAEPAPGSPPERPLAGDAPPPAGADGAAAAAAAATAGPDASAPPFDWPPSTRLRYALTGNYRGPVEGRAQVEWLRSGTRYQVHLDVTIGAPFAPIITRQMSSDGVLGPAGLVPERYDERTRLLWHEPRQLGLRFEPAAVRLANGGRVPRPPGVQDAVSQFVQLAWRFTLQPGLLVTGGQVELPLALPRGVDTWVYDVREAETFHTPAGPVDAVRLQPRRQARAGGDLVPEMWFAPALQYLPVRILIRQDDETFVDLRLDQLPQQAADPLPKRLPQPMP